MNELYVAAVRRRRQVWHFSRANPVLAVGIAFAAGLVLIGLVGPLMLPDPSDTTVAPGFAAPTSQLLLGSDRFGRDVLARVVGGIRWSLFVAGASVLLASLIGSILGLLAAYAGGLLDRVITRILDLFLGLPVLVLAMALIGGLGPGLRSTIIALVVGFVPAYALIIRSATQSEKGRDYVLAAITCGASTSKVVFSHLLPNVLPVMIVQSSITLSHAILAESALGFLGLGLQPPIPSWGQMLSEGRPYLLAAPWISVFPGIAIFISVFTFNILGDGLRDYLDPRLGRRSSSRDVVAAASAGLPSLPPGGDATVSSSGSVPTLSPRGG